MTDWIEQYAKWSMKRSPLSPMHFHRNIGLTLAAGAIAGRVHLRLPHEDIYPNLFTLVIAKTTVFGKTTTFSKAREVINLSMKDKMFREVTTPESLIEILSGQLPKNYEDLEEQDQEVWDNAEKWQGRRLFMLDEAGRLFNIMKKDYNSDLADILMALYDPSGDPISRRTRKHGSESIKKYALSCLFGTTPNSIRTVLNTNDAWGSGFWVRWNFVAQENLTDWMESVYADPPKDMVERLQRLSQVNLEAHNDTPANMAFDPKFLKALNDTTRLIREQIMLTDNERMHGMLGRLPIAHAKAAMIYALLEADSPKIPKLELHHWEATQSFAEGWRRDAELVDRLATKTELAGKEERVYTFLEGSPMGATTRECIRHFGMSGSETLGILETFKKMGAVEQKAVGKKIVWVCKEEPKIILNRTE